MHLWNVLEVHPEDKTGVYETRTSLYANFNLLKKSLAAAPPLLKLNLPWSRYCLSIFLLLDALSLQYFYHCLDLSNLGFYRYLFWGFCLIGGNA